MKTQNEYTPKLEMDRTTVDGLFSCQSKFMFSTMSNRNFWFVRSLLIYHCYNWYFLIYPFLVGRETADFVQGKDLKNYDPLECKSSLTFIFSKSISVAVGWGGNRVIGTTTGKCKALQGFLFFSNMYSRWCQYNFMLQKIKIKKNWNLRYTFWTFSPNTHISADRNFWFCYLA